MLKCSHVCMFVVVLIVSSFFYCDRVNNRNQLNGSLSRWLSIDLAAEKISYKKKEMKSNNDNEKRGRKEENNHTASVSYL